jgi:serine/threonine-protein phosphatase 6 regulatory ankyrin repeat subunit A
MCLEILVNERADVNAKTLDGKTPLHMTAVNGRFTRAQTLINNGANVLCADQDGNTAVHIAARYGHELLINTLVQHGADVSRPGVQGMLPVHMAAMNGYLDCFKKLVVLMPTFNIDTVDDLGRTCLHAAACGGNLDIVDLLLASGADCNLFDNDGRTALHYAACMVHHSCVMALTTSGAKVNVVDTKGCSPLHYAAAYDSEAKVVEHLLRHGADAGVRDHGGYNAAHYAAINGLRITLEMLLEVASSELLSHTSLGPTHSPLHLAAYSGFVDALTAIMNYTVNLDIQDNRGRTALHLAASRGHLSCCEALLGQGATASVHDMISKSTPLHLAAVNGHVDCARVLLQTLQNDERDAVDSVDELERTALMLAASRGHVDMTAFLISAMANILAVDIYQRTALHMVAANGHEECADALIQHGASVNAHDVRGRTPLHMAAMCGHVALLGMLLQAGGNVNILDNKDYTPLHWACYNGHESCVELLLDQDRKHEFVGNQFTPLHCAVINGNDTCTELLLENRGPIIVNLPDSKGRTAVHAAVYSDRCEALQMLLSNGGDITRRDSLGRTPLMYAAMAGRCAAIEQLCNAGVSLSDVDNENNTALHHACSHQQEKVALSLLGRLNSKADINAANSQLRTPLHIAARHGLVPVVQQLISKAADVYAVDNSGHIPALSCAPDLRVAECLSMILRQMFPQAFESMLTISQTVTNSTGGSTAEPLIDCSPSSYSDGRLEAGSVQSSDSEFY